MLKRTVELEHSIARAFGRKRTVRAVLMLGGILVAAVVAATLWLRGGRYVSADDAYVRAAKLMVTTDVPSSLSLSTRRSIRSVATGFEKSSNSLQYVHARLQRRIGMMCTRMGCLVEARAFTIMRNSRARVRANRAARRTRTADFAPLVLFGCPKE